MGYYDDEGNYHSFRRAPEKQFALDEPQLLRRRTTFEPVSYNDNGEGAGQSSESHGYYDDEGNYHSLKMDEKPILERRGYYDDEGNYHSSFRKSGNTPMRLGDKDHGSHYGPEQVIPIPCHFIRIGDLLILNDRPCQVIRISVNPQTGQHRYLGVDLFTRQLHEDKSFMSKPSANVVVQTILGPVFRTYRVLDVDLPNGTVTVMTETGDIKAGLPVVKQGSLIAKLEGTLNKGIGNVRALAISEKGTGRELVCDYKVIYKSDRGKGKLPKGYHPRHLDESENQSDDIDVDIYRFCVAGEQSGVHEIEASFPSESTCYDVHLSVFQGDTGVTFKFETPTTDSNPLLFRWIHMKRAEMRFKEFKESAIGIPDLNNNERIALKKLLQNVEKGYDHEPNPGTTGRFMKPGYLTETFQNEKTGPDPGVASWLCLPYFRFHSLRKALNKSPDSYPMRTLLHDLLLPPEREISQVMSRMQPNSTDECLHIAQMWAIEVNNSLLLTCGDLELSSFGDMDLKPLPRNATAQPPKALPRTIFVSFYERVMWSLPLEGCITWPSFLSHFVELDISHLEFRHKGNVVGPSEFAGLLETEHSIRLALSISGDFDALPSKVHGGFTVLGWLTEMNPELQDGDADHEKDARIKERLALMDEFFQRQKLDSRFYGKAQLSDCYAVQWLLKETEPDTCAMRTTQAAELLYSFFVPPNIAAPVLGKYWGAVYFLIQSLKSDSQEDRSSVQGFCDQLIDLALQTVPVKVLFSRIGLIKPPTYNASHPLERAWMHFLMSLIYVKAIPHRRDEHMRICLNLFEGGIRGLMNTIPMPALQKQKVVLPLDIATLMGLHLLDKTSPGTDIKRIFESYSEYSRELKKSVQLDQLDISHEDSIDALQKEIKSIQDVLASQKALMDALAGPEASTRNEIQWRPQEWKLKGDQLASKHSKPGNIEAVSETNDKVKSDSDSQNYRQYLQIPQNSHISLSSSFSKDCRELLDHAEGKFSQLMSQARRLEDMNEKKIRNNKSRQEFAIYAFTVVTIIFLPLNTVSSIFGMNTIDIRNINSGQWIYWAVAIPLTVIVMVGTLLWAGEFKTVYKAVKSFIQPRSKEVQPSHTNSQKSQL